MNFKNFKPIFRELKEKYNLPENEVLQVMARTIEEALDAWFASRHESFYAHIDSEMNLRLLATRTVGGFAQRELYPEDVQGWSHLQKRLEDALQWTSVYHMARACNRESNKTVKGEVRAIDGEGTVYVEVELLRDVMLIGRCPTRHQARGDHERFRVGEKLLWNIRRAQPIRLKGIPRVDIQVDRLSKRIVQDALQWNLGPRPEKTIVHCHLRDAGVFSEVWSTRWIPKTVLEKTMKEVGERIKVVVAPTFEEFKAAKKRLSAQARARARKDKRKEAIGQ